MDKRTIFTFLAGAAAAVTVVLAVGWLYQKAGEYDARPKREGLKRQMMQRKSATMRELLETVRVGQLGDVSTFTAELQSYSSTIERHLSTDAYARHGADYFAAIRSLNAAAAREDHRATKEAVLSVERSCIDCHYLLVDPQAQVEPSWR
ncbi:MAG: hypothetical protein AAFQ65_03275 [Myxococcota bacterium]